MSDLVRVSAKAASGFDPTIYPVEEKVGEDLLQRWIVELLRPLLERWFSNRGVQALVGADQFIYYRQHAPTQRVSPDIYVLPGVSPTTRVTSWKIWETDIVPSFALEVVSKDWEKDCIEAPERCADAGVAELVIFDPAAERHEDGVRWQVFRRVAGRRLARIEASASDRVRSRALGGFLRVVGEGANLRVRIGGGPGGNELFPTGEEAAVATRDAALERIATLEAQLRKARRSRR